MAKTGYMTIRVPPEVLLRVRAEAKKEERTIAGQVLFYIMQGLTRAKK